VPAQKSLAIREQSAFYTTVKNILSTIFKDGPEIAQTVGKNGREVVPSTDP
jgi:hypothetical protein